MMHFNNKIWTLKRYPKTVNRTLRAWSAADELLLKETASIDLNNKKIALVHDSFGALACPLFEYAPLSIINYQSQLKAIRQNLELNKLEVKKLKWQHPLTTISDKLDLVLIKIPKSADLFELYLSHVAANMNADGKILCGFMTRNFTPKWIEIAERYFGKVTQSKAEKKARLLILEQAKTEVKSPALFHSVKNDLDLSIKQYSGVFSSGKIDAATTLLINDLQKLPKDKIFLDLACGNGVIASYVQTQNPGVKIHVLDDNFLAIRSAKLNLPKEHVEFHWSNTVNTLNELKFDVIACNPPFHFEYENTIEIAQTLFKEAANHLTPDGEFLIVANTHLNYKTHLSKLFGSVKQVTLSGKFETISCRL